MNNAVQGCVRCLISPSSSSTPFQVCSGCKRVAYCSRDCQKVDWKDHKVMCKMFKESKDDGGEPIQNTMNEMITFLDSVEFKLLLRPLLKIDKINISFINCGRGINCLNLTLDEFNALPVNCLEPDFRKRTNLNFKQKPKDCYAFICIDGPDMTSTARFVLMK